MQFSIKREALLKPLQPLAGILEKRQEQPILANILVVVKNQLLSLTATDLEIEMIARVPLAAESTPGAITIPGKKITDICKALPEGVDIHCALKDNKVIVKAGKSRFSLACLPAKDFPNTEETAPLEEIAIAGKDLSQLLEATHFAMAHQDVRYYLNGLCLIFGTGGLVRAVATDGHRLSTMLLKKTGNIDNPFTVILPRKAVLELQRLLSEHPDEIGLVKGQQHLRAVTPKFSFITKLVEGKFPDYKRVLPPCQHELIVSRETLRQALLRVSALFSDRYHRGVGLQFQENLIKILAVNSDKDEVEDEIVVNYQGPTMEIGVNATYLLEYLNVIKTAEVKVKFTDPNQVIQFEALSADPDKICEHVYAVMPMRL